MKSSLQQSKNSSTLSKAKKNSKDRDKRKSQAGNSDSNNHSSSEKGSPSKESNNTRLYAGIDAESLIIYGQQVGIEHLSEDVLSTLTEDINYKLRYIINDSLIRARLSGRNAISSSDIEHTFESLKLNRVYGAPSQPNWRTFDCGSLSVLDEKIENLVEIAEEETVGVQYSETILVKKWLPESKEISQPLKTFYVTMCQHVIHEDYKIRRLALHSISNNCRIGPITEWFYNFGYILLSKDVTYDCLTVRALDLIAVLETSPLCRFNVPEKQLKLLTRLILQRLLKSEITLEVLKRISAVLEILCRRGSLKDFVFLKIQQKLQEIFPKSALAIISITNAIGDDAIASLFLPNIDLFLQKENPCSDYTNSILELYNILWKRGFLTLEIYSKFYNVFGDALSMFYQPIFIDEIKEKKEINLTRIKCELVQSRRKITPNTITAKSILPIESVFVMPPRDSPLYKKLKEHKMKLNNQLSISNNNNNVLIGKTTLLLPVFKYKGFKMNNKSCDTSLLYNL